VLVLPSSARGYLVIKEALFNIDNHGFHKVNKGFVVHELPGDHLEILVAEDRHGDEVSAHGEVSGHDGVAGLRDEAEGLVVEFDRMQVLVDHLGMEAVDIVLLHKAGVARLDTEAVGTVLVPNKEVEGQHNLAASQDGHTSFQVLKQLDYDTRIADYALLCSLGFPVPREKETYTQPRDSHLCPPWLRDLEIEFHSRWNQMSCRDLLGRHGRDGRGRLLSLHSFRQDFCGYGRLLRRQRRGYC
jgi:hypothetical protein